MIHSKECEIFLGQRHFVSKTLSIRQIHILKSLGASFYSLSLFLDSKIIQNKIKQNRPILMCILQKYKRITHFVEFFFLISETRWLNTYTHILMDVNKMP